MLRSTSSDLLRIERLLKSRSGTDLDWIWKGVKKDVETIVELPAGSEQVKKYSRISSYSRLLSMILAAVSFVFLVFIYLFQFDLVKSLGIEFLAPALVIGVLYVMMNGERVCQPEDQLRHSLLLPGTRPRSLQKQGIGSRNPLR